MQIALIPVSLPYLFSNTCTAPVTPLWDRGFSALSWRWTGACIE